MEIQGFNPVPPVINAEHVTGDNPGQSNRGGIGTRRLVQTLHKGNTHVVDHVVGNLCRDDFTPQLMLSQLLREFLGQIPGKHLVHFTGQKGIVRQGAVDQGLLQVALHIGNEYRQFRPGQPFLVQLALGQGLVIGQELQGTIELALALKGIHQPAILFQPARRILAGNTDGLGLTVVVLEHQLRDVIGHLLKHDVALLVGEITHGNGPVEQDLHVDLVVRTIHTAGVVDKVRVQASALERKFNATELGKPKVAALTDHLAAKIRTVDPQTVVGLVAHITVGFTGGLHIGANATDPEQVDLCLEDMRDQHVWWHPIRFDTQQFLHFRADRDRF